MMPLARVGEGVNPASDKFVLRVGPRFSVEAYLDC
jgi:hypothetical protein